MLKAVIFDMDGVLIDSEPYWRKAEYIVLKKHHLPVTQKEVYLNKGVRIDKAVENWLNKFSTAQSAKNDIVIEIIKRVASYIKVKGKINKGALNTLRTLGKMNIKKGLASSAPEIIINLTLNKLGIKSYFEIIHCGEKDINPKPAPDIFLEVARKLNIKTKECLVIEDSIAGVKAAKSAGMFCIAINDKQILSGNEYAQADIKLESFAGFNIYQLINHPYFRLKE